MRWCGVRPAADFWLPGSLRRGPRGAEKDATLPMAEYEKTARERLPQVAFKILPGVGHVPMIDDPDLVARTILAVTSAAKQ
jgi:pimeloyl-ACP methyl ester carboxylesterase